MNRSVSTGILSKLYDLTFRSFVAASNNESNSIPVVKECPNHVTFEINEEVEEILSEVSESTIYSSKSSKQESSIPLKTNNTVNKFEQNEICTKSDTYTVSKGMKRSKSDSMFTDHSMKKSRNDSSTSFSVTSIPPFQSSAKICRFKNILIIDNSLLEIERKILYRMLQKKGYNCDVVKSGKEGVEIIKTAFALKNENNIDAPKFYDAILMDLSMTDSAYLNTAPTLVKTFRELGFSGAMIGVKTSTDETDTFPKTGFCQVISKPYNVDVLNSILEKEQVLKMCQNKIV